MKRDNWEMLNSLYKVKLLAISELKKHKETIKNEDLQSSVTGIIQTHQTECDIIQRILDEEKNE